MKLRPLVAVSATLALVSLSGCQEADAKGPAAAAPAAAPLAQAVKLVAARSVQAAAREEVTGQLYPAKGLQLGFEVGGRLATVKVKKGQRVKEGDVLAQLNSEIADAQVSGAEAALQAAEAAATMARDLADRQATLKGQGSVSELQSRTSAAQAAQAEAQVLAARAQLSQARAARRRHDLRAPFAGTVIDAPEQVGATVAPGTSLFTLEQVDSLLLKTTVAEGVRGQLKVGSKVRVEAASGGVSSDEATVRTVLPSADAATRRVPVELVVPNADGRFVANTLARASLNLGEPRQALLVPATALSSSGGDHVFVVDQEKARRVAVQVLERRAREVVVQAQEPLTQVIDYPSVGVTDGARVSVK
ncbi:efflux RND transporter periplasmic adaptor subunit [Aggregicoccus sp. 17bor-14]|uniref:efflux RND transporter periplasmic adaptor subunit n=1 Tax=Myxococcaceae TaxID=31 RepID=UPI00129C15BF|nr:MULTISPECIES: efflux RND transporter periplasmic adaptor subunit [Myxococcaceae]MBF5043066.1 efflux RND transporter periplasmic adaptor subunit [Simulacricoccus sp. 17bor-14]MRI88829.1 efflux RND transporter periplasmic adaptor subunit [Aggregicoccus sp. 17bor-14]